MKLINRCLLDVPKSRIVVPIADDPDYKLLRLRMSREGVYESLADR
jgi:hypothetical protein